MRTGGDSSVARNAAGNETKISESNTGGCRGNIALVGIGPGGLEHLSFRAHNVIKETEVIVGYKTYLKFISQLIEGKEIVGSGMRREVERGNQAVAQALAGKKVAVISSGDAGVYGMAGLVLEILSEKNALAAIEIEVIPGITAANAAAACLGAPLMHDYASISLSDLLTPWEVIRKRVELAGQGDFVLALYNPKSRSRVTQIEEVQKLLLRYRSPDTPVGIVQNACRTGQRTVITSLKEFTSQEINMLSIVIIGNSQTKKALDKMITPRGYRL